MNRTNATTRYMQNIYSPPATLFPTGNAAPSTDVAEKSDWPAYMQQQQQQQQQQQEQQGDSPAHRIYRHRSAKTFSQMMRSDSSVPSTSGDAGRDSRAALGTGTGGGIPVFPMTGLPDYMQPPQQQQQQRQEGQLFLQQPQQFVQQRQDAQQQQQQFALPMQNAAFWAERQEKLLLDIERRLERLEEQQHERRKQQYENVGNHAFSAAAASAAAASNDTIVRLLDQMQEQQRQMRQMQEQMDALRRAMQESLEKSAQMLKTASSVGSAASATDAINAVPALEKNAIEIVNEKRSATQSTVFWLASALVVTFLFALVAVLIAAFAFAKNKSGDRAPTTIPPVYDGNIAYIPIDLSQSGGSLVFPSNANASRFASSPAWNSTNSGYNNASIRPNARNNEQTIPFSPQSSRINPQRFPVSYIRRSAMPVLFSE